MFPIYDVIIVVPFIIPLFNIQNVSFWVVLGRFNAFLELNYAIKKYLISKADFDTVFRNTLPMHWSIDYCDQKFRIILVHSAICSFSNLSVISPTLQLILPPFCFFTYVTAHSPTFLFLHLRHRSFCNPSFASPTSQTLHLRHLASRPWQC